MRETLKIFTFLLAVCSLTPLHGQENDAAIAVDSLYREDQIYAGLTFNLLTNTPAGFDQNGLSAGIQFGVIRDFPINKARTSAIGIGVGLALDTYNQNLRVGRDTSDGSNTYAIIPFTNNVNTNRFTSYSVEFPIEYRWRTSTPTKYSFWRVHLGLKLGYNLRFRSTFEDSAETIVLTDLSGLNKFQYGPTVALGYGAFNFQAYYGLSSFFSDSRTVTNDSVGLNVIRLGLIFYFL